MKFITRDFKFLFLTILLVIFFTYAIGYIFYREFNTPTMVLIMGWIIVFPVCFINSIFLYLSDLIRNKIYRLLVAFAPIILFILYLLNTNLNAAHTPLALLLSLIVSNIFWAMTYKKPAH